MLFRSIAREKAEAERIAREKAEAERLAREKAEAERLAKEKAEAERIAREKAEAERIAREKAEAERHVVDIAIQGNIHSEDELCHTYRSLPGRCYDRFYVPPADRQGLCYRACNEGETGSRPCHD